MSDTAPVDVVRDAYAAFGRGDIPAVLELLSDDIRWDVPEPVPHAAHATGRDEVGQFFGRLAELWTDFGIEVDVLTGDAEGHGIGIGRARGKLDGTDTGYGFTHVFTVRDGKVVRFDEYVAPPEGGFPG